MKLRVIDGGRKSLENRVIKDMMNGKVRQEDLDRLRPRGSLYLVSTASSARVEALSPRDHQPPHGKLGH